MAQACGAAAGSRGPSAASASARAGAASASAPGAAGEASVAAEALGRIGDPAVVKPLTAMLRPDKPGAEAAADALGELRDPAAIEALRLDLMENPWSERAAKALGQIPHPDSVAALVSVAGERNSVVCKHALQQMTGRSINHQGRRDIQKWWEANRSHYAP